MRGANFRMKIRKHRWPDSHFPASYKCRHGNELRIDNDRVLRIAVANERPKKRTQRSQHWVLTLPGHFFRENQKVEV